MRMTETQLKRLKSGIKATVADLKKPVKRLVMEYGPQKALRMSEAAVLRGCKDILAIHPSIAFFWRQQTGSMASPDGKRFVKFSFRGASDLMAVIKGQATFLAIECKATGKKASPEQAAFLDNVLDAGGYAVCVDSPQKLADYLRLIP